MKKWANKILKDCLIEGYAINKKRLIALDKTIEIQSKIIASTCEIDVNDVRKVVDSYTDALTLLDNYDHQCIPENKKSKEYAPLTYKDIRTIINSIKHSGKVMFSVSKKKKES